MADLSSARGRVLLDLGRADDAVTAFRDTADRYAVYFGARGKNGARQDAWLVQALARAGRYAEAAATFDRIERAVRDAFAWTAAANCFVDAGDLERASDCLSQLALAPELARQPPVQVEHLIVLSAWQLLVGELDASVRSAEQAVTTVRASLRGAVRLARRAALAAATANLTAGNIDRTLQWLVDAAFEHVGDGTHDGTLLADLRGAVELARGNVDVALAQLAGTDARPRHAAQQLAWRTWCAQALLAAGRASNACRVLEPTSALLTPLHPQAPQRAETLAWTGLAHLRAGDQPAARAALQAAEQALGARGASPGAAGPLALLRTAFDSGVASGAV